MSKLTDLDAGATPQSPATPDAAISRVLDEVAALGQKPIETLSPEEARQQPLPADGVLSLLRKAGKETPPQLGVETKDFIIPGPAGGIQARLYGKAESDSVKPVLVYWHGGGWVIADLDDYDSTPRAMARAADCIVVSCHYRRAPEHKFPAAHEDAWAAYQWVVANAASLGGDPARVAVMGESAGGNLAANVSIMARDEGEQAPLAQILVYPVAGNDMNTVSYIENANAKPLSKPMMEWFVSHVFEDKAQTADPRINLVAANLADLPPTTIIAAEIDPLRTEGQLLARRLDDAGTDIGYHLWNGATHEFFGMGLIYADAAAAEGVAGLALRKAFGQGIIGKIAQALG
ncbi:alpha/beta hydrolase [Sphingoaurantiacus capsulatus]|uniref:Alpha/beta hydrolase n=1 Tax=Sphingoaurantiacus capsulatus TaxID=1771310 RepID=A0ABV7X6M4_9SPHN